MVLNNKFKYYILVALVPLGLILCWKLAFSVTLDLYFKIRQTTLNTTHLINPDITINLLSAKLKELEVSNVTDPEQLDDKLIELLSKQLVVNSVLLESISEIHSVNSTSFLIKTFKLEFSGKFTDLVRLMDFIENEFIYFKPISANFHREELKGGVEKLYLDLYLQTFINISSE